MPAHPSNANDGAWSFTFPAPPGSVHYIETPYRASTPPQFVSITFKITSDHPIYNGQVDPNSFGPATFHLMVQRAGDDLRDVNGRWWSYPIGYELGSQDNGVVTLTVPLKPDCWINVNGNNNAEAFEQTLSSIGWVGLTFGSSFLGHGVNILDGTARFTLVDYRVW